MAEGSPPAKKMKMSRFKDFIFTSKLPCLNLQNLH